MEDMTARVVETRRLTDHMVRVVLAGDDLVDYPEPRFTDAYMRMTFPGPDGPVARRYTVRRWEPSERLLTVDFVVHGDDGVAGPWAATARPGDEVGVSLPGGGYRPAPDAAWHLMVGDESALPAIAASLEVVPPGVPVVVRVVCDRPQDQLSLDSPGTLDLDWLHRRRADDPEELLAEAVQSLPFLRGPVQAFVHGEASEVRQVRRHLLDERGVPREALSCSGYWRRSMTDEQWRQIKRAWNEELEQDVMTA